MTDIDRPGKASAKGGYADSKPTDDERTASAGFGRARAEWSVFDAEAKGAIARAGVKAGQHSREMAGTAVVKRRGSKDEILDFDSGGGFRIFRKAELASASATVGPMTAKVGLAVDTGIGVSRDGVEAKVLGTGFSLGRKTGVSLLGNELSFQLW